MSLSQVDNPHQNLNKNPPVEKYHINPQANRCRPTGSTPPDHSLMIFCTYRKQRRVDGYPQKMAALREKTKTRFYKISFFFIFLDLQPSARLLIFWSMGFIKGAEFPILAVFPFSYPQQARGAWWISLPVLK
ncbi:hypothetical protein RRX38_16095 [Pseudomonas sp. DTU_2021_1001937_2_SI_NGA_ILE_001]|uniref:hypothetical protein n=1 Tax=Pseudomonas sp. DTU_2021_1001937_2_SI_NGA_ILE_001 TaxID=3077589 RepID=UPI0028FC0B83|nr:hypothetical protein [Pseudomonas sp. DTU_2021_1001937_2_SI_NGA_ILE_001]WNW12600.1 hypothetical protein RRX38_16095 [Pseudomonas sp. DTU_2021_1001937_2_SI_NGA_ILE_001]